MTTYTEKTVKTDELLSAGYVLKNGNYVKPASVEKVDPTSLVPDCSSTPIPMVVDSTKSAFKREFEEVYGLSEERPNDGYEKTFVVNGYKPGTEDPSSDSSESVLSDDFSYQGEGPHFPPELLVDCDEGSL
jgi:hypothetical protein